MKTSSTSKSSSISKSSNGDHYSSSFSTTRIALASNGIFVVASILYVTLSVLGVRIYQQVDGIPADVVYAQDDATWMQYFNDTGMIPDSLYLATDDTPWTEWYSSVMPGAADDDTIFVMGSNNAIVVTQYMAVYFCAAVGFFITGGLGWWDNRANDLWGRLLYTLMVVAACFGIVSSTLVVTNPHMALVMNCISVHLFAIEAVSMIIRHVRQKQQRRVAAAVAGATDPRAVAVSYHNGSAAADRCLIVADMCLLVGTMGDVILSYFHVLQQALLTHAYFAVVAAVFWLLASLLYLSAATATTIACGGWHNKSSSSHSHPSKGGDDGDAFPQGKNEAAAAATAAAARDDWKSTEVGSFDEHAGSSIDENGNDDEDGSNKVVYNDEEV